MKFDIGQEPTDEEWRTYFKCRNYLKRETVAEYLEWRGLDATQEQFDGMYAAYEKFSSYADVDEETMLRLAWEEVR